MSMWKEYEQIMLWLQAFRQLVSGNWTIDEAVKDISRRQFKFSVYLHQKPRPDLLRFLSQTEELSSESSIEWRWISTSQLVDQVSDRILVLQHRIHNFMTTLSSQSSSLPSSLSSSLIPSNYNRSSQFSLDNLDEDDIFLQFSEDISYQLPDRSLVDDYSGLSKSSSDWLGIVPLDSADPTTPYLTIIQNYLPLGIFPNKSIAAQVYDAVILILSPQSPPEARNFNQPISLQTLLQSGEISQTQYSIILSYIDQLRS